MSGRPAVEAAIIVAGGQSSRMGTDKAQIPWMGCTLLKHVYRVCRAVGLRNILIVGRAQPPDWEGSGASFLPDEIPHSGPLGGVVTGLEHLRADKHDHRRRRSRDAPAPPELALVLPCDLPLLNEDALLWLIGVARACREGRITGAAAVTPNGQIQPLFAVYSTALLPALRLRAESGHRSLLKMIEEEGLLRVPLPEPIAPHLASVNTPEEFDRVTRTFREKHSIPRGINSPE